ncbi:hypothetical protein LCGC14_1979040 [marine sediment metagenome]|uniref:Uncharacterized protein n=1 Tax=marine sediment metagenome TaxID=412755 RepID=A0A0F9FXP4_9ZZZZ
MNHLKKIKISTVENKLNEPLIRGMITIGFDVSEYNTGIAILRTTEDYLILEQTKTIKVPKGKLFDSVDLFLTQIKDFKNEVAQKYKINLSIIEDCFYSQNVKTLKTLARFGILVYDKFRDIVEATKFVTPTQARAKVHFAKSDKKVKGKALKKEIIAYVNYLLEIEIESEHLADSVVLALAGLIKE